MTFSSSSHSATLALSRNLEGFMNFPKCLLFDTGWPAAPSSPPLCRSPRQWAVTRSVRIEPPEDAEQPTRVHGPSSSDCHDISKLNKHLERLCTSDVLQSTEIEHLAPTRLSSAGMNTQTLKNLQTSHCPVSPQRHHSAQKIEHHQRRDCSVNMCDSDSGMSNGASHLCTHFTCVSSRLQTMKVNVIPRNSALSGTCHHADLFFADSPPGACVPRKTITFQVMWSLVVRTEKHKITNSACSPYVTESITTTTWSQIEYSCRHNNYSWKDCSNRSPYVIRWCPL